MSANYTFNENIEVLMFLFVGFITWLLLLSSMIFFFIAIKKKSWKTMMVSSLIMIPNIVWILSGEVEKVMYLYLLWFGLQLFFLFKFRRAKHS
ncbi:hypothetical protein [Bacillus sp. MUM 13]|uniref:hypothetical protein n=1 Tax=Bacillus sp. MUM 13 TaxID=1678001 RepID=UPI0008F58892|nr:hypothetical protein [Bacillus sp. MUM 13]OIK10574.1 hypothetical protein BIV59_14150 [Bacillus sp. MUM 13]